jgi:AMMECR1 domain-containing protein
VEPYESSLAEEIERNAVSAAFCDHRFEPITYEDLEDIEISVDVLTKPEKISSFDDLDPLIFGVIVCDDCGNKAVLLPSIPSVDTVERQIEIVKRKAGLAHKCDSKLSFYRFTSNRYH